MDVAQEELKFLTICQIVREAVSIPQFSTRTFSLITLTLIFPLSLATLANSYLAHPFVEVSLFEDSGYQLLYFYHSLYFLSFFLLSLLSTAAVVFTVASLYTSKPTSFSSTIHAILPVFRRLLLTFLFIIFLLFLYDFACFLCLLPLILMVDEKSHLLLYFWLTSVTALVFLAIHIYITALWHLASVVTVLEPLQGWAAMRKSRDLLKGRTQYAAVLVSLYFIISSFIGSLFRSIVVRDVGEYGLIGRVVVGIVLFVVSVVVNSVGLLVQSVFYYVCKSYHNQPIDKSALYDHLGGYLGEYVPVVKGGSIQMENVAV